MTSYSKHLERNNSTSSSETTSSDSSDERPASIGDGDEKTVRTSGSNESHRLVSFNSDTEDAKRRRLNVWNQREAMKQIQLKTNQLVSALKETSKYGHQRQYSSSAYDAAQLLLDSSKTFRPSEPVVEVDNAISESVVPTMIIQEQKNQQSIAPTPTSSTIGDKTAADVLPVFVSKKHGPAESNLFSLLPIELPLFVRSKCFSILSFASEKLTPGHVDACNSLWCEHFVQ